MDTTPLIQEIFVDICLQIFIIIFVILLYQMLLRLHEFLSKRKAILLAILCSVAVILSMSFSISDGTNFSYDFHIIPWMIAFLYGGWPLGITVTIVMFFYRAFFNLDGLLFAIPCLISIILAFYLLRHYHRLSYKNKIMSSTLLVMVHGILFMAVHHGFYINKEIPYFWLLDIGFILIQGVTTWLVIYIIETTRENNNILEELEKSERIHMVGQLAASVAHEVRNPITVIKGFLQLLRYAPDLSQEYRGYIKTMESELSRATDIINDYLSLAKDDRQVHRVMNIYDEILFVKNALKSYAVLNGVQLRFKKGSMAHVHVNRERLHQVLINLIKNAIEATQGNGFVDISIHRTNRWVVIYIIDDGVGMSKDQKENAGKPFFTTKEGGTGLGLMVCREIIDYFGGWIDFRSQPNQGTTVTVHLPEYKLENEREALTD